MKFEKYYGKVDFSGSWVMTLIQNLRIQTIIQIINTNKEYKQYKLKIKSHRKFWLSQQLSYHVGRQSGLHLVLHQPACRPLMEDAFWSWRRWWWWWRWYWWWSEFWWRTWQNQRHYGGHHRRPLMESVFWSWTKDCDDVEQNLIKNLNKMRLDDNYGHDALYDLEHPNLESEFHWHCNQLCL